jgi:site-specific recombinase XerD
MLEKYFSAPKTLARLRAGLSGPHIDDFADALKQDGYSQASAVRYLRAAAHLGQFQQRHHSGLTDINASALDAFRRHLPRCRCPQSNGGKMNHHVCFGAKRFYAHLLQKGVCQRDPNPRVENTEPALVGFFRDWFRKHRGASESTLRSHSRGAADLLDALGEDPSQWNAQQIRGFLLDRVHRCGKGTAEKLVTAMRAFLRYLGFRGLCRIDLDQAVPSLAHWRLATLPQSLTAQEVDRLVAACNGDSTRDLRDRAIILLLVRLGLRAGDVAQLRLADIEWESGTLRVSGKSRYEVCLPLPQDVGDAVLRYLECRPEVGPTDRVFIRNIAPFRPFVSNHCVSGVVKRALRRAGLVTPKIGAHLLRHTAATQMLQHGVPLDQIGLVLRHRGIDTTAYYAKVDIALLLEIAQPWPEVNS